jgi:hypothetical protein
MFDDFREDASKLETEEEDKLEKLELDEPAGPRQYFLGMTPFQRFIISVELLLMVVISGAFILLVLGRVVPSFAN